MSACEKCWEDAYLRMLTTGKSQADCYRELLDERRENPCTPEEQAGSDATRCPNCGRKAVHQYAGICMSCDWKPAHRRIDIHKILDNQILRRELMVRTIQATQAREGIETTREQAEHAYDKIKEEV